MSSYVYTYCRVDVIRLQGRRNYFQTGGQGYFQRREGEFPSFENSAPLLNCARMVGRKAEFPSFKFIFEQHFCTFFKQQMQENGLSEFVGIDNPLKFKYSSMQLDR